MAGTKTSSGSVEYRHDPDRGEHQIGVTVGDTFVPFIAVSDVRFNDLVTAANSPEAKANSTDDSGEGE